MPRTPEEQRTAHRLAAREHYRRKSDFYTREAAGLTKARQRSHK